MLSFDCSTMEVIKNRKSPFFKRRTFFSMKTDYSQTLPVAKEFLDFLEKETSYDTALIYSNLIRTCHQKDLVESFQLFHVI